MAQASEGAPVPPSRRRGLARAIWALEHAQDYVAAGVGIVLIILAVVLIVSGAASFIDALSKDTTSSVAVTSAAVNLVDRVLLVLILAEIVHTVVLSLRTHRLNAQPFIVIGLVAVIRRILFVLSSPAALDVAQLGLLIGMVIGFVAGLIAVSLFETRGE